MYPSVERTRDIPYKDILMVMDCDHLVEPEFFAKACAVMLDRNVAVCLVPQAFHNEARAAARCHRLRCLLVHAWDVLSLRHSSCLPALLC